MAFSHEHIHSGGIANKKLSYYDGMLKLVYKDGDRYNSAPVNRSTEIIFLCDNSAGDGSPYFKAETDRTYTIEWYTALACLPRTVECSVADEEHGLYYDLTGLAVFSQYIVFMLLPVWTGRSIMFSIWIFVRLFLRYQLVNMMNLVKQ